MIKNHVVIKGKARGGRLREGTLVDLESVLAGEATSKPKSGSLKRASSKPKRSTKRSLKQLSFPSKLGFAGGSTRSNARGSTRRS